MERNKPAALIIGAGIAGIQAALDIADAGFPVYLVEREPSVGGRMAQLDKTFPTLDCSSCILTPKMVDVGQHPNIELMTYSEVESVELVERETGKSVNWETGRLVDQEIGKPVDREAGKGEDQSTNLSIYPPEGRTNLPSYQATNLPMFRVRVRKKPRYVDVDKCTGCGACAEACRMKGRIVSDFDEGIAKRSSIYVPFPQAVPLKYTIDPEACLYLTRGVCGKTFLCKEACPSDAIDFEQEAELVDLEVGAIIVATGYDMIDPTTLPEFGYGVYPEVMTGLEFERLSDASGPTKGEIFIPEKDRRGNTVIGDRKPEEVVFIKCVGSRDPHTGVPYCSRFCCMYTAKHAHLVRDKIPDANITVFYMDVRAFGKGYEEFYDRVKHERVIYRRGEPSEIYRRGEKLVVLAEDTLLSEPIEVEADLVVLATAVVPRADVADVAEMLDLERSPDGFFQEEHPKFRPVDTRVEGLFLAGCCQGPKDIPDTVAHAKAAASSALRVLVDR